MKKIILMSLVLLLTLPLLSIGQETTAPQNLDDISAMYAECAAYYRTVNHTLNLPHELEAAESYRQLENTAKFYSLLLTAESGRQDKAVAATRAKFEKYVRNMSGESDTSNEDVSRFINKYQYACREAIENPSDQLVELLTVMMQM